MEKYQYLYNRYHRKEKKEFFFFFKWEQSLRSKEKWKASDWKYPLYTKMKYKEKLHPDMVKIKNIEKL